MNIEYNATTITDFMDIARPYIIEVVKDLDLNKIGELIQSRIEVLDKRFNWFFDDLPEYDISMYVHKKMKTNLENSLEILERRVWNFKRSWRLFSRKSSRSY